jgi:hypothetical protein
VVHSGDGTLFAEDQNCTICPAGVQPTKSNAEIVRITNISTDTFTIIRTQEGSSARTIQVGDQIFNSETPKILTDIENATLVSNGQLLSFIFQSTSYATMTSDATELIRINFGTPNDTTTTEVSCPNLTTVTDEVSIDSTVLTTLDLSSLQTVGNNGLTVNVDSITSLDFSALTSIGTIGLQLQCGSCTSTDFSSLVSTGGIVIIAIGAGTLSFPALTTLGNSGFSSSTELITSIELPLVVSTTGGITIQEPLTTLDISSYTTGNLTINSTNLTSLDISLMSTGNSANVIDVINNLSMTSVVISSTIDSLSLSFNSDALTQTAVDNILINLDTAGYSGGFVDVSGGTNSTPGTSGLLAKTSLQGKGWTVNNN